MKMREVLIVDTVLDKISELKFYLVKDLKLSRKAALKRTERMDEFLKALGNAADYPLCRFRKWCSLGYRCAVFEKDWVFAYELFEEGIIVRDMSHTSILKE